MCKGVSLGDILGNTLRSNYIVCNMLIGHLHSFGACSPALEFKIRLMKPALRIPIGEAGLLLYVMVSWLSFSN